MSNSKVIDENLPGNETNVIEMKEESNDRKPEIIERSDYLCLGRKLMKPLIESKLKCFYLNTTLRPYLRLTRIRVEELYKRPQIVLIHNFLSETEAQSLINISEPLLYRMMVVNDKHQIVHDKNRISYGAFLNESQDNSPIQVINRRISGISGLVVGSETEQVKVVRYNVGGHYEIHHDGENDTSSPVYGRIGTWINYLSDVDAGGATVIPKLNITIFPEKYSALHWYNLLSSGDVDDNLLHTGCPVLYGRKRITVRHIRIKPQTVDTCALNRNEYRSLQVI